MPGPPPTNSQTEDAGASLINMSASLPYSHRDHNSSVVSYNSTKIINCPELRQETLENVPLVGLSQQSLTQLAYYHNLTDVEFVRLSVDQKEKLYHVFVLHVQDSGEHEVEERITETDQEVQSHTVGTFDNIKVELPQQDHAGSRNGSPRRPPKAAKQPTHQSSASPKSSTP